MATYAAHLRGVVARGHHYQVRSGGGNVDVTAPKTLSFTVCSLATCSLYDQQLTRWAAGIWPGAWVLGQQVLIDGRSGGHVDV